MLARDLDTGKRARLYRLRKAGKLRQLARGAYLLEEDWHRLTHRQQRLVKIVAHCRTKPGHIVVGRTAAFVLGLPTPTDHQHNQLIELGSIGGSNGFGGGRGGGDVKGDKGRNGVRGREGGGQRSVSSAGLKLRHLPPSYRGKCQPLRTQFGEIYVSVPEMLVAELLLWGGQLECLVATESMLNSGVLSSDDLETSLSFIAGRKGDDLNPRQAKLRALETMRLMTSYSESPRESEVKYQLWKAGFPAPYQQVDLFQTEVSGEWARRSDFLGRVDFMFPCGLVLEYDGRDKYLETFPTADQRAESGMGLGPVDPCGSKHRRIDPQKVMDERKRERRIQNQGFEVIRVDAESFSSGVWLDEVRSSLDRRAREGLRAPEGKWRAHTLAWRT